VRPKEPKGSRHSSSPGLSLFPLLSSTLPGLSASEVTTLRRYTNLFIIIIFFGPSVDMFPRVLLLLLSLFFTPGSKDPWG